MSMRQQSLDSIQKNADSSWRKRPIHLGLPVSETHSKRLKRSPATSSSGQTHGDEARPAFVRTHASIPTEPISRRKAERWFDATNEHPTDPSFVDNDPPYYMKDQLLEHNSACATLSENSTHRLSKIGPTAPTRSLLAQMNADNNDGDEYRSVIDDLTIQNKKLQKKLKKYEVLHCSHLQEEKLFEVRIHGLAANRKHELEETLRSFASSIDEDSPHRLIPADLEPSRRPKLTPLIYKPSSSTTSASKPALDSTYASMSGLTVGASHPADHTVQDKGGYATRQSISSHLSDIPEAFAPKSSITMSDRSKSKSIVIRLEQLFTGKAAASRQHGHSPQPPEASSHSVALVSGQRLGQEGTREAHILSVDTELQVDLVEDSRARANNEGTNAQSRQASHGGSPRSPEQRPTRPLDLDLHRAQDSADNMEYIRHLGPTASTEDPINDPASKDGWVYLNLLMGMAQLHNLNVTPEFIRKAVSDFSSKLKLSSDHSRVRWLGGSSATRMSSDGDDSEDQTRRKPSSSSIGLSSKDEVLEGLFVGTNPAADPFTGPEIGAKRRPININQVKNETDDVQYKPLFFHTAVSDEDASDAGSDTSDTSGHPGFTTATGLNSGATALDTRVTRLQGPSKKNGPMIFYNRAKFCTDLSGDLDDATRKQCNYQCLTKQPIGVSNVEVYEKDGGEFRDDELRLDEWLVSEDVDSVNMHPALNLDDLKSVISDFATSQTPPSHPMDLEASGIGGIQPEDNFVVEVRVQHGNKKIARQESASKSMRPIQKVIHNIRRASINAFINTNNMTLNQEAGQPVQAKLISAVKTDMAPSALPPPSYICLPFSSSSGSSDEDEGEEASEAGEISSADQVHHIDNRRDDSPDHHHHHHRDSVTAVMREHQHQQSRYSSPTTPSDENRSDNDASDDDDESSSSIDLLAHARGLDPETIAAREREFESNTGSSFDLALAEVPAGSSAATNGGGSGKAASPRYDDDGGPIDGREDESRDGGSGSDSDINSMSVDGNGSIAAAAT